MTKMNRRDFLKASTITVGAGAIAAAGSGAVAPKAAMAAYDSPAKPAISLAVKEMDVPSYMLPPYADADKLTRFDGRKAAYCNKELWARDYDGVMPFKLLHQNKVKKCNEGIEGWSVRDLAFSSASEISEWNMEFLDWGLEYQSKVVKDTKTWEDTPENNSLTVKKVCNYFGSGATGIAELNPQWVYSYEGGTTRAPEAQKITLDPNATELIKTDEEIIIPGAMKYVIVILIPSDGEMGKYSPTGLTAMNGKGYSEMSEIVGKVATFIRDLGYRAIPATNNFGLSVPMAVDAGLGEVGRHGLLINPEYGSMVKICKVITDLPLKPDKPIYFGAAEFCKTCMKCAHKCPSKSISMDEDTSYEAPAMVNHPGMKRWYTNGDTCLKYWVDEGAGGCTNCIRTCTYSKPQTWVHDVIKITTSKTTMFNSIFSKMDDAFGYGGVWEDQKPGDIEKWWSDPETRTYDWTRHTF